MRSTPHTKPSRGAGCWEGGGGVSGRGAGAGGPAGDTERAVPRCHARVLALTVGRPSRTPPPGPGPRGGTRARYGTTMKELNFAYIEIT